MGEMALGPGEVWEDVLDSWKESGDLKGLNEIRLQPMKYAMDTQGDIWRIERSDRNRSAIVDWLHGETTQLPLRPAHYTIVWYTCNALLPQRRHALWLCLFRLFFATCLFFPSSLAILRASRVSAWWRKPDIDKMNALYSTPFNVRTFESSRSSGSQENSLTGTTVMHFQFSRLSFLSRSSGGKISSLGLSEPMLWCP